MAKHQLGLLSGPKFSNKHSTAIEAAHPIIRLLRARPEVKKIVLSEIRVVGVGKQRIKTERIPAGLRVVVRGKTAQQTFFVYTDDPDATDAAIGETADVR